MEKPFRTPRIALRQTLTIDAEIIARYSALQGNHARADYLRELLRLGRLVERGGISAGQVTIGSPVATEPAISQPVTTQKPAHKQRSGEARTEAREPKAVSKGGGSDAGVSRSPQEGSGRAKLGKAFMASLSGQSRGG